MISAAPTGMTPFSSNDRLVGIIIFYAIQPASTSHEHWKEITTRLKPSTRMSTSALALKNSTKQVYARSKLEEPDPTKIHDHPCTNRLDASVCDMNGSIDAIPPPSPGAYGKERLLANHEKILRSSSNALTTLAHSANFDAPCRSKAKNESRTVQIRTTLQHLCA